MAKVDRAMNGQLADRFVKTMVRRRGVLLWDGVDVAPGEKWSMPFNAPEFLMALQEMDDMNAPHNEPWWHFLHVGGPLAH